MGSPNAAKETGRLRAKRLEHAKAENEGKIIQTGFDNSKVQRSLSIVVMKVQIVQRIINLSRGRNKTKCKGDRRRSRAAVQSSSSKGTTFPSTM